MGTDGERLDGRKLKHKIADQQSYFFLNMNSQSVWLPDSSDSARESPSNSLYFIASSKLISHSIWDGQCDVPGEYSLQPSAPGESWVHL
jgi:hypothetical protein